MKYVRNLKALEQEAEKVIIVIRGLITGIKLEAHVSGEPHHDDQEVDFEKRCLLHI